MESAEECMCLLRVKANECKYKERDRKQKYQFINRINDDETITEIIKKLTTNKKINEIPSDQVFSWAKRVEAWTTLDTT